MQQVNELNQKYANTPILEVLQELHLAYPEKVIFTTSFGYEDQVITDIIFTNNIPIRVVTLDTGRLFKETYKVYNRTLDKYGKAIECLFPESRAVAQMVSEKGPFSFYESVENRKECCNIRKVVQLDKALAGMSIWITGIRASQSDNRSDMQLFEYDEKHALIKYNPLLHWSYDEVKKYVHDNGVPYNILHDKGFVSIGCEPCTRAIQEGEDFRAGRWWWEDNSKKECGLHSK